MPTEQPKKPKQPKKPSKLSESQLNDYIEGIYSGKYTSKNLPKSVYTQIAEHLMHGVQDGYGMTIENSYNGDLDLLNSLRENVYMFSAAKTYQMSKEISSLLIGEDGKLRTNKEFNKIARETYKNWNDNYGETEYSTAVGQAYSAQKWKYIESQKQVLPNLRYSAISDPCDICAPLDGLVAPVDDPIWNQVAPLNHFNCRCILVQEDATVETTKDSTIQDIVSASVNLMSPLFRSNPGKDGVVFNESHPYFDVPKKDKSFAEDNFGLPLPEPVVQKIAKSYEEAERQMYEYKPTQERSDAINSYTSNFYSYINDFLRKGKTYSEDTTTKVHKAIPDMSYFLKEAPKCEFTTYRGLNFYTDGTFSDFMKDVKVGKVFMDKGFMSTSPVKKIASEFSGSTNRVFLTIEGRSGVSIKQYSVFQREHEVLFDKGTKFKITRVQEEPGRVDIHLKEL